MKDARRQEPVTWRPWLGCNELVSIIHRACPQRVAMTDQTLLNQIFYDCLAADEVERANEIEKLGLMHSD